jgi:hypothetical protein
LILKRHDPSLDRIAAPERVVTSGKVRTLIDRTMPGLWVPLRKNLPAACTGLRWSKSALALVPASPQ